jgi:hypothetical protein
MEDATLADVLLQLLEACHDNRDAANALARRTDNEELKAFLHGSAHAYQSAETELSVVLGNGGARNPRGFTEPLSATALSPAAEVADSWECAECDALACFRDAFDGDLPPPLARTIRRHYEAGIARLERLRELRAHLR